jgi:hypothetical protein
LKITLLRPEEPGAIILQSGDIDNRLKTLFDALSVPAQPNQLPKNDAPNEWARGTLLVIFLLTLFATMVHFAHATPSPT